MTTLHAQTPGAGPGALGITAIPGVRVGHSTRTERPTGCTVILLPEGSVGGVDVRGGAPGTAETDVLAPDNLVQTVNAIVLSGGSAYGLDARSGVMTYLEERKVGFRVTGGVVPIVPAAILFDLGVGAFGVRPDARCGYEAASSASGGPVAEGSVGAGAGATVGKLAGPGRAMKGGVGTASFTGDNGLIVGAIVVVNAVGTVIDRRTGQPIAGVRTADGKSLENPWTFITRTASPPPLQNTTIGVVATNARLTKAQALRVSEMAHDGIARAIVPSHTQSDGDTLFAIGTGGLDREVDLSVVGRLAAEAVSDAIERAVQRAKGLPGLPSVSDLK